MGNKDKTLNVRLVINNGKVKVGFVHQFYANRSGGGVWKYAPQRTVASLSKIISGSMEIKKRQ